MHDVENNTLSYRNKSPEKCIQMAEKENKMKYLESCLQKLCPLYPFVVSTDGLLGVEAEAMLKRTSTHLSTKCMQPYSRTYRYVKSRVAITLVHFTHNSIWGSRVMAHKISIKQTQWEYGSGLHPFR